MLVDRGYRGATLTEAFTAPPASRTVVVTAGVVRAAREAGYLLAGIERGEPVAPLPLQWPGVLASRRETARRLAIRIWRRQSLTGSPLARGVDAVLRSARRVFPR
jgi:hypothetical protein